MEKEQGIAEEEALEAPLQALRKMSHTFGLHCRHEVKM